MRSRTSTWFETKVKYQKTMEDGSEKVVSEAYVVDALKTEKEKRSNVVYLVQAKSLARALRYIDEVMGKTMIDYDIVGLNETKLMDVFEHHAPGEKKEEKNDVPEYEQGKAE